MIAMSTLSQRLRAIQIPNAPEKMSFEHLSMKDLETFLEMWTNHQDWMMCGPIREVRQAEPPTSDSLHRDEDRTWVNLHGGPKELPLLPKMKAKASCRKKLEQAVEIPAGCGGRCGALRSPARCRNGGNQCPREPSESDGSSARANSSSLGAQCGIAVEACPCWAHGLYAGDFDESLRTLNMQPLKPMWNANGIFNW